MNQPPPNTNPLPLESLIQRLEASGYAVSPRQRLQLWRILEHFGASELKQPEQLKYRMAPVLVTNAEEQKAFYTLFDQFLEESRKYEPPPVPEPPPRWWERLSRSAWVALLGALLLLSGGGLWYVLANRAEQAPQLLKVSHDPVITLGKSFRADNQSGGYDTTTTRFRWELQDAVTGSVEDTYDDPVRWIFRMDTISGSYNKKLLLIAAEEENQDTFSASVKVVCATPPDARFEVPDSAAVMERLHPRRRRRGQLSRQLARSGRALGHDRQCGAGRGRPALYRLADRAAGGRVRHSVRGLDGFASTRRKPGSRTTAKLDSGFRRTDG